MSRRRHQKGFSLIELMLVVAMIGILASIFIPSMLDALHRAKQRRTMGELALVGQAWMSWLTDQAGAASAGSVQTYDVTLTYLQLFGYLHPNDTFFYMQEVPQRDAWGSRLIYWQNPNLRADRVLAICAAARGDIFDTCNNPVLPIGPFSSTNFDNDIIWADGGLIRWPEARN